DRRARATRAVAPRRAAADEQGQGRRRALRPDPLRGSPGARARAGQAGPAAGSVGHGPRAGERGPRTVEGGRAARGARRPAGRGGEARPRQGARVDGDPPGGRGPGRRARLVPGAREARCAPRSPGTVDGDERRFRGGDRGGSDDGARRDGDLRPAPGRAPKGATRAMTIKGKTIGFVGAGNMGEAMIKGLVAAARLRTILGPDARLIRVMPNAPALVLEGVTAIAKAEGLEPGDLDTAREIFSAVGRVVVLDEELLDAVTGLSGSGPAYVALV